MHPSNCFLLSAMLFLSACETAESNDAFTICDCYEEALTLTGEELRDTIRVCAKESKSIKEKYKEDPVALAKVKEETTLCMKPMKQTLAAKSAGTKTATSKPMKPVKKHTRKTKGGE